MNFLTKMPIDVLFQILNRHLVYSIRNISKELQSVVDFILNDKYRHVEAYIPNPYKLKLEYISLQLCNATTARSLYKLKTFQLDILNYIQGKGNTRLYNLKEIILTSLDNFSNIQELYDYHNQRKQRIESKLRIKNNILHVELLEEKLKKTITSLISSKESLYNVI
jgi:hypothetical protein